MDLKEQFEKFIREKNLFGKKDSIILAVSGGVDSVVMAELFHRSKYRFAIAHCNFNMRGDESDADEVFVGGLAVHYQVPFFSTRFDTRAESSASGLSIQETARRLRYDWFAALLKKQGYSSMATAHHFNDSVETFFINLLRGTGISGLRGIAPVLEFPRTVRPLLFARRAEIESFAGKEKIRFRLDHSNETDMYLRNRIRHHLMPVLLQLNPQFEKVMERNLQNLAFAGHIVNEYVGRQFQAGFDNAGPFASHTIGINELKKSAFPLETLMAILQPYGFNISQLEDAWSAGSPGKQFLADGFVLTRDRDTFILSPSVPVALPEFVIEGEDKDVKAGVFHLSMKTQKKTASFRIPEAGNRHCLDKGKLEFPLVARKWKKGDFFFPLGMTRRKKISDFLIDNKVSRPDKEKTYVLLSGKDIVCVLGHRLDNRYKVTDKTKEVYQIVFNVHGQRGTTGI